MLEKTSNGIMFAVIGFGGFLGIGEKYHAIPWSALDYDEDQGGYVVPFTKEQLEAAPSYSINDLTKRRRQGRARRLLRILQGRSVLALGWQAVSFAKAPPALGWRGFCFEAITLRSRGVERRSAPCGRLSDCTTS